MPSGVYERKPWMKSWGRLKPPQIRRAQSLRREGWDIKSLAWSFGVSQEVVRRALRGYKQHTM